MLDAYDIDSTANGLHHVQMNWYLLFALGGITISVFGLNEEAARSLVNPVDDYIESLESETLALGRRPLLNLFVFVGSWLCSPLPIPLWLKHRRFVRK